jgi:transposase-like protein
MSLTLNDVSALTEQEARAAFERVPWPNGPVCHRCGSVEVIKLEGDAHRVGLYQCRGCEGRFSSTTGTILEQSHLPIRTWLMAFAIIRSAKKGERAAVATPA